MLRRLYSRISCISIHSLARRLTAWLIAYWWPLVYFNSQPRKEADSWHTLVNSQIVHFNSQPRKEADMVGTYNIDWPFYISIHSLARRLTEQKIESDRPKTISIHSLARRLTLRIHHQILIHSFQFTASQGGWLFKSANDIRTFIFQFTASQGGWRHLETTHSQRLGISIHSLARRLTFASSAIFSLTSHFNSQPRKEADDGVEAYN